MDKIIVDNSFIISVNFDKIIDYIIKKGGFYG